MEVIPNGDSWQRVDHVTCRARPCTAPEVFEEAHANSEATAMTELNNKIKQMSLISALGVQLLTATLADTLDIATSDAHNLEQFPLHKACRYSNSSVAVKQLNAANINALTVGDADGNMALHCACHNETAAAEATTMVVLQAAPDVAGVARTFGIRYSFVDWQNSQTQRYCRNKGIAELFLYRNSGFRTKMGELIIRNCMVVESEIRRMNDNG